MMMMMSSLKLALIFGAALGLYQFNAQDTNYLASVVPQYNTNNTDQLTTPTSAVRRQPGFDYFLFVLQWPAAFCNIKRSYGTPCKSLDKHKNKFTVHGLWPQLNGAESPVMHCQKTNPMKDNDFEGIKSDLLKYWPNLFARDFDKSKWFWEHEWDTHGTCSSNRFTTPREYLIKTLNLARRYAKRIFEGLHNQGINPDELHPLKDLRKMVRTATGTDPVLNIGSNSSGHHLLLEIQLCVENDGATLMDCDEAFKFVVPR